MSTVAGEHYISASVNGAQKTVTVKFNADASTGQANLLQVDTAVQKVANGKDAFTLTATVEIKTVTLFGTLVTFNLPRVSSRLLAIMSG